MSERFPIRVTSEIGRLTGVILHEPGQEVANMTPETAERALYSDILNLEVARQEYAQLHGVLARRARVFQVRALLADILGNDAGARAAWCAASATPRGVRDRRRPAGAHARPNWRACSSRACP